MKRSVVVIAYSNNAYLPYAIDMCPIACPEGEILDASIFHNFDVNTAEQLLLK